MENIICKLCAGSPEIELYKINTQAKIISTDICIGKEVEQLINKGVITYGCCCGHGGKIPTCLVDKKSLKLLEKLGYKSFELSDMHTEDGIFSTNLKTDVQCELRKVLSNKIFRYLGGN